MSNSIIHHRNYNVGTSDYSEHRYQPWDIWRDFELDPLRADIVKRLLRRKNGEERITDLKKIQHVIGELKHQHSRKLAFLQEQVKKIQEEYHLSREQEQLLNLTLMPDCNNHRVAIRMMEQLIEFIIAAEQGVSKEILETEDERMNELYKDRPKLAWNHFLSSLKFD
ncbi:MAG: hypothetical protein J6B11_10390 [Spirochaetales bacterium]|nr:hypothetical protein [Spirochaetales bacterium]